QTALADDDDSKVTAARTDLADAIAELTALDREQEILRQLRSDAERECDTERRSTERAERRRFLDGIRNRLDAARATLLKTFMRDDIATAISEYSLCSFILSLEGHGPDVDLDQAAAYRATPDERASGSPAENEAVSLGVPVSSRTAPVGGL